MLSFCSQTHTYNTCWCFMIINHSLIFNNFPLTVETRRRRLWGLKTAAGGLILLGFWFHCGMDDSDWLSVQVVKIHKPQPPCHQSFGYKGTCEQLVALILSLLSDPVWWVWDMILCQEATAWIKINDLFIKHHINVPWTITYPGA